MVESKFNIGDHVKVIKSGFGFGLSHLGKVYVITTRGIYNNEIGYRVIDAKGNLKLNPAFDNYVGESSFEHHDSIKLLIDNLNSLERKIKEKEK